MSGIGFELKEKVEQLTGLILERHPRLPVLLREIHTALQAQPENVTLMTPEEISLVVKGLMLQTNTEFAQSAISGSKSSSVTAKIKKLGADAF